MTADFQRVYGLRLRGVLETYPEDEILDLVLWLPSDSAFRVSLRTRDPQKAQALLGWDVNSDLMLLLANLLQANTHATVQVASTKKVTAPKPIPHPMDKPKKSTVSALAIGKAMTLGPVPPD